MFHQSYIIPVAADIMRNGHSSLIFASVDASMQTCAQCHRLRFMKIPTVQCQASDNISMPTSPCSDCQVTNVDASTPSSVSLSYSISLTLNGHGGVSQCLLFESLSHTVSICYFKVCSCSTLNRISHKFPMVPSKIALASYEFV